MSITKGTPAANKAPSEYIPVMDIAPVGVDADPHVPMAGAVDFNGLVVGRWKAEIFGCFTDLVPNCIMATFCPCISLAQVLHRLGLYTFNNTLIVFGVLYGAYLISSMLASQVHQTCTYDGLVLTCTSGVNIWIYVCTAITLAMSIVHMTVRGRVRNLFQIPGTVLEDCLCAFFCGCCSIAQMATHTDAYTAGQCAFGPKDVLPGYHMSVTDPSAQPSATPVAAQYINEEKGVAYATPAPQVVIVQPTIVLETAPVDSNGLVVGRWKADICGCFTDLVPNCCMAFWCPCVSMAQIVHRIGLYSYSSALVVLAVLFTASYITGSWSSCSYMAGTIFCSTSSVFWGYVADVCAILCIAAVMMARMRIRAMFQIPGNACEDCLCAFFCSCCSIAQMATQTDSYTASECNFGPKQTLQGYVMA
ncbi:PLAC8 family protein [Achlya hypogyna]|uniref:PLAC8 family protein n=1 Tax=Achlya hypogyna TaxID=1202772 RepID=A0A1V9ZRV0_ACHHY|nr:PLAC8 family protein [Achlya hypogyna]